jgi:hypothetical protein
LVLRKPIAVPAQPVSSMGVTITAIASLNFMLSF